MKRFFLLTILVAGAAGLCWTKPASAGNHGTRAERMAARIPSGDCWHGSYYHTAWGMPTALVIPPTAERQVHWGWGIGNTRITPIWPQYSLGYYAPGTFGPAPLYGTPPWPSDLNQFGAYYIRGPW